MNSEENDDFIKNNVVSTVVKIDPRKDISISEVQIAPSRKTRPLNANEFKKLTRALKEEPSINQYHPELASQEKKLYENQLEFTVDYTPIPYLKSKLMDHQYYGVSWMQSRELLENGPKGGILADEMGLGKTIQTIGLILRGNVGDKNLVVVPSVALPQWISEIEKHAPGAFNIISHYGRTKIDIKNRDSFIKEDKFNIILTTYGTVENTYRKGNSLLHSIKFKRIILDEAHIIKDNKCNTSKAINALASEYRWGLTGTPVQNRVNDLLSLIRFLKIDPQSYYFCKKCDCKSLHWLRKEESGRGASWCACGHFFASHFSWWNRRIANPIREWGHTDQNDELFARLKCLTEKFILRRTKIELEKSLGLPSKIVIVKRCLFSPQELEFYKSLYSDIKSKFNAYSIRGQVANNYAHIFELLQKMRMAVNHPFLTYKNSGLLEETPICGFCNAEAEDPVRSKCNHVFCRGEVEIFLQESNKCPVCHVPISIDLMADENIKVQSPISIDSWESSTKIETLIEMLSAMKGEGRKPKSIVFSQFVKFLEILRWRLERAGFRCVNIYGSMPMAQRKAAIEEFNSNPEITVFLISLKAGGVALNLTEAENVFIMDLWWNPAVEEQAMDRIHRIGQFKSIRIYRIIIEDSIESRVLMLQKKKKALFETAVDNNMDALQRLSEEDLQFLFS